MRLIWKSMHLRIVVSIFKCCYVIYWLAYVRQVKFSDCFIICKVVAIIPTQPIL